MFELYSCLCREIHNTCIYHIMFLKCIQWSVEWMGLCEPKHLCAILCLRVSVLMQNSANPWESSSCQRERYFLWTWHQYKLIQGQKANKPRSGFTRLFKYHTPHPTPPQYSMTCGTFMRQWWKLKQAAIWYLESNKIAGKGHRQHDL